MPGGAVLGLAVGLAHLNLVSIHPWLNGNGRTPRVLGSLVLMRRDLVAPELVNVESVIRANPEAYVAVLQESHGPAYQPDEHAATPWLEYFARLSVDRLELRARLDAAIRNDFGVLALELSTAPEIPRRGPRSCSRLGSPRCARLSQHRPSTSRSHGRGPC